MITAINVIVIVFGRGFAPNLKSIRLQIYGRIKWMRTFVPSDARSLAKQPIRQLFRIYRFIYRQSYG